MSLAETTDINPIETAAAAATLAAQGTNPGQQNPTLNPSAPYQPGPAPAPTAVNVGDPNASARQIIADTLAQWGLASLVGTAWDLIQAGAGFDETIAKIRQSPEYAQRFAGNVERTQRGYTPLSEDAYLAREEALRSQMQMGGLPPGFWDQPSDFAEFIGRGESVESVAQRIEQGYVRVAQASPYTRQWFADQYGPASDSALAAFFLDETGTKSLPVLERMATQAEIGGAAARYGFGVDLTTAARLASLGVTGAQATAGFGQIADLHATFTPTITEGNDVTAMGQGVAAVLEGDTAATEAIKRRQATRQAAFDETGAALTTGAGVLGLGTLK